MVRVFISHASKDGEEAASLLAWLREQGFDTAFLDFDNFAGIPPGADWERTLYREVARSEAILLILSANWFASKWCFAEYTQARALGKAIFLLIVSPEGETYIAPDIQHLDLRKDREGGLERLSAELTRIALDAHGEFAWDRTRPPFPGLLAYDEADAAIYFGRGDDIRRLIERLNARRAQGGAKLVALLGASGSGKSSLTRAGILPRLKRDNRNWIIVPPFRPQFYPVDELAQAFALGLARPADWREWRDRLSGPNPSQAFSDLARDLRAAHGSNEAQILISIDQGEELFGTAERDEARRFFALLNNMLGERLPFLALLNIRSDYLGQLQQAEGLMASVEEFSLKPMPIDRVPQIIAGPARVVGLAIDDALIATAAKDAATDDALPLLAFALRQLYDLFGNTNHLSLAEYRALGDESQGLSPLENAVRRRADEVLSEAKLSDDDLVSLKEAFVPAMVRVNAEGEYVRQPAQLDQLPATAQPILERLARARLLVIRQDGESRQIEVVHEALLRKWPRLRGWLDEEREFLVGKEQLVRDLRDWQLTPESQKADALLSGLKLTRAKAWLIRKPRQLSEAERTFIQQSEAYAEAEITRRERLRRKIQIGSIAATVLLAMVAALAGWQARQSALARNDAEVERAIAQQNSVLAERQRDRADGELQKALRTESLFLTDLARQQVDRGDGQTALLLALVSGIEICVSWGLDISLSVIVRGATILPAANQPSLRGFERGFRSKCSGGLQI
ncbi:MAG: TIR domain-containing protein [Bradyrhizobium sp.]